MDLGTSLSSPSPGVTTIPVRTFVPCSSGMEFLHVSYKYEVIGLRCQGPEGVESSAWFKVASGWPEGVD